MRSAALPVQPHGRRTRALLKGLGHLPSPARGAAPAKSPQAPPERGAGGPETPLTPHRGSVPSAPPVRRHRGPRAAPLARPRGSETPRGRGGDGGPAGPGRAGSGGAAGPAGPGPAAASLARPAVPRACPACPGRSCPAGRARGAGTVPAPGLPPGPPSPQPRPGRGGVKGEARRDSRAHICHRKCLGNCPSLKGNRVFISLGRTPGSCTPLTRFSHQPWQGMQKSVESWMLLWRRRRAFALLQEEELETSREADGYGRIYAVYL